MPRAIEPVATPNQYLRGDIVLSPPSDPAIAAHAAKGRSVSGRSSYRLRPQKRASSLVTSNRANAASKKWAAKEEARRLAGEVRSAQAEMVRERIDAKREKRQRALDNERRRMENEYNNARRNMQVLNAGRLGKTLKSMNKKQLRQVKKSRMNSKTGVVEFVGAYEK
jgi:hypothetical protein